MTCDCIVGTGIDIIENDRIQRMLDKWGGKFKDRVFLPAEQTYCNSKASPAPHYAGRFAAKEAVSKAFGTGMGPRLGWLDIEVTIHDETGAPAIGMSLKARSLALAMHANDILVSISHTRNYAVAHAFLIARKGGDLRHDTPQSTMGGIQ